MDERTLPPSRHQDRNIHSSEKEQHEANGREQQLQQLQQLQHDSITTTEKDHGSDCKRRLKPCDDNNVSSVSFTEHHANSSSACSKQQPEGKFKCSPPSNNSAEYIHAINYRGIPSLSLCVQTVDTKDDDVDEDDEDLLKSIFHASSPTSASSMLFPPLVPTSVMGDIFPISSTDTDTILPPIPSLPTPELMMTLSDLMSLSLRILLKWIAREKHRIITRNRSSRTSQRTKSRSILIPCTEPPSDINQNRRLQRRRRPRPSEWNIRQPNHQTKPTIVRGLVNNGQTCFLNSILQALASLPPLIAYLERIAEETRAMRSAVLHCLWESPDCDTTTERNRDWNAGFASETLLDLLISIGGSSNSSRDSDGGLSSPVDPRRMLRQVGQKHGQFGDKRGKVAAMEQQDAQEFLQALMGMIVAESEEMMKHSVSSGDDIWDEFWRDCDEEEEDSVSIWKEGENHHAFSFASLLQMMDQEQKRNHEPTKCDQTNQVEQQQQRQQLKKRDRLDHYNSPSSSSLSSMIYMSRKEEKKQEDCDDDSNEENDNFTTLKTTTSIPQAPDTSSSSSTPLDKWHDKPLLGGSQTKNNIYDDFHPTPSPLLSSAKSPHPSNTSASMRMLATINSTTPSPLSGWVGSHLRCTSCHHVRPIQNAPFLDIPVVPTSISSGCLSSKNAAAGNVPPCTLHECLLNFSSVERVKDVECRSCAIRVELERVQEEIWMLESVIGRIKTRRRHPKDDEEENDVAELERELEHCRFRHSFLSNIDPDADDDDEIETRTNETESFDTASKSSKHPPWEKPTPIRGDADKCLLLTRLPSILCLHVQRRYYDPTSNRMSKTMQHVDFPEMLDASAHCAYGRGGTTESQIPYRLMSVVEHRGNAYGGHYQTYRRLLHSMSSGNEGKEWALVSDEHVEYVDWEVVRNCQAYMLFYEAV